MGECSYGAMAGSGADGAAVFFKMKLHKKRLVAVH